MSATTSTNDLPITTGTSGLPNAPASPARRAWLRFRRNRPATISAWFLAVVVALVVAWPIILFIASHASAGAKAFAQHHDPDAITDMQFRPPDGTHWFGTDVHGRDLFSRTLYGAQISLLVGAVGALVSLVIGVLWGAIAGYAGGRLDNVMMRIVDILYSLPSVIFVMILAAMFDTTVKHWLVRMGVPQWEKSSRMFILFFGLGVVSWLTMARIVRGQVLTLRHRPFVEASRVLGARSSQILFRHILPNVWGVVIVYLALTIPAIILYESFLSFLGLGIEPPMASWGSLIADGAGQINTIQVYWWLLAFPGFMLVSTLLALNYLGDGLRDAWDVRGN